MLRASFAGYVFELNGCDTMHNADKFAQFPTTATTADCCIDVIVQEDLLRPDEGEFVQTGDFRCYPCGAYKRYYHRHGTLRIEATDDFSSVRLTLCDKMPMWETVCYLQVQQMIGSFLLLRGVSLVHSAGLTVNGRGVLLCGRSGVGKSTMRERLQDIGAAVTVLSEDMPALCTEEAMPFIYGTPLCGDDEHCDNARAPLSWLIVLRQAKENRLLTLSATDAMFELLMVLPRAVYAPTVTAAAADLAVALTQQMPIVLFENDGTAQAAQMLLAYFENEPRDME